MLEWTLSSSEHGTVFLHNIILFLLRDYHTNHEKLFELENSFRSLTILTISTTNEVKHRLNVLAALF